MVRIRKLGIRMEQWKVFTVFLKERGHRCGKSGEMLIIVITGLFQEKVVDTERNIAEFTATGNQRGVGFKPVAGFQRLAKILAAEATHFPGKEAEVKILPIQWFAE